MFPLSRHTRSVAIRVVGPANPALWIALIVIMFAGIGSGTRSSAETWTSLTGNRSVQARMLGLWNDQVVLILGDGRRVSVPMDSLVAESRIQARKIAETLDQNRQTLRNELESVAAAEAAPAPQPIPTPPAAPAYASPRADQSPSQFVKSIQSQLQAGHLIVIYDSLPPSYRTQLDGLVQLAMKKVRPSEFDDAIGQLHRLADLIVTRQNWLRSYPRLNDGGQPPELNGTGEVINQLVIPVAGLLRAAIAPDQMNAQTLSTTPFGEWLRQRDETLSPYLAVLMQQYASQGQSWVAGEAEGDKATIQTTLGGASPAGATSPGSASPSSMSPSSMSGGEGMAGGGYPGQSAAPPTITIALKKVDGYWLPTDIADGFPAWVEAQTAALQKFDDATMGLADWLGGRSVAVESMASANEMASPQNGPPGYGDGMSQAYEDPSMFENPSMSEDPSMYADSAMAEGYGGMNESGYGAPQAAKLEPPAITPEMIGTFLQSISMAQSMIAPFEAATDAASFHLAIEQTVASLKFVAGMLTGR